MGDNGLKKEYFMDLAIFLVATPIITILLWNFDEMPPMGTVIGFIVLLIATSVIYYRGVKKVHDDMKNSSD